MIDNTDFTSVTCNIGNPLPGPGDTLRVATTITPRTGLVGDEDPIPIMFSVTSVNPEALGDDVDNTASGEIEILAAADVFLDNPG